MKLRICNACGAFISIHDNDKVLGNTNEVSMIASLSFSLQRLADHLGGKLHLGCRSLV